MEIFKDVPGFEGCYQVSNLGNIKSMCRERCSPIGCRLLPEIIVRTHKQSNGYCAVWLRRPGVNIKWWVHRLVASVFIPNPENKAEVNHRDKCRTNNCVDNLEWMTYEENQEHKRTFINETF